MAFITPKTDWQASDEPVASDINRIEGNINYIEEETRIPSDLATPVASGKLSLILNYIVTRIKSITGKTNWYTAPDTTLAAVKTHMDEHIRHSSYAVATGAANTYAVTLSPVPSAYVAGMVAVVKINVTNTGASTLNVNAKGAKSIKKSNGNDVLSGNLKAYSGECVRWCYLWNRGRIRYRYYA